MKESQHLRPVALGLLAGSALVAVGVGLLTSSGQLVLSDWQILSVYFGIALAGVLVLGLPLVLLLRQARRLSWLTVFAASILGSNLYAPLLAYIISEHYRLYDVVFSTACGLLMALGFCLGTWPRWFISPPAASLAE